MGYASLGRLYSPSPQSSCLPTNPPSASHNDYELVGSTSQRHTLLLRSSDAQFCSTCNIYIAVEGIATSTTFRLVVATSNAIVELTTDGHVTTGEVFPGKYDYFSFSVADVVEDCLFSRSFNGQADAESHCPSVCSSCPNRDDAEWNGEWFHKKCGCKSKPVIQVDLTHPSIGDADLFMKANWDGVTLPVRTDSSTYDFKSQTVGNDHLLVKKDDSGFCSDCDYGVGVYGYRPYGSSANEPIGFALQVSTNPNKVLALTPRVPYRGYVSAGQYKYFKMVTGTSTAAMIVTLQPYIGNPDMFISRASDNDKPTSERCVLSFFVPSALFFF